MDAIVVEKKERDSNMELLRIITMLMILLLHADFFTTGCPSDKDMISHPFISFIKAGIEALTIISVNVFVLLSGWYGIRPKKNRLLELIFQVFFFHLVGMTIALATQKDIKMRSVVSIMENLWFVKAYLLLYILSPVLNAFTENSERHIFRNVLIGFFMMQFLYGWLPPEDNMPFTRGFSTISFIGLYLLARYVRLHKPFYALWSLHTYLYIFLFLSFVITGLYCVRLLGIIPLLPLLGDVYSYTSPFVILSSLSFLLLFSKLSFRSKFVNSVAKSCFAVYLFHVNKYFWPYFVSFMHTLYQIKTFPLYLLYSTIVCILIYIVAILLDRVRIYIYKRIFSTYWA